MPTWSEKIDLPHGWYSASNIQYYFEYIIQKHEALTDNPPIRIYVNKVQHRMINKIKIGYHFQLLTPETIKIIRSTKSKITKDENGENVLHLDIPGEVLVYCNNANNDY